jgi:hypothetical protein
MPLRSVSLCNFDATLEDGVPALEGSQKLCKSMWKTPLLLIKDLRNKEETADCTF